MDAVTEQFARVSAALENRRDAVKPCLLIAGSRAYGLATEDSDVDVRGFAPPTKGELLSILDFEQLTFEGDAVVYSFAKFMRLLLACNPNIVELLAVPDECVIAASDEYTLLRENVHRVLSCRCAITFGGYATQQLRRIQNAMNRETSSGAVDNALRSARALLDTVPSRLSTLADSDIRVDSVGGELRLSGVLSNVAPSELRSLANDVAEAQRNADALLARNVKRTSVKLAKHASHLIRLLRMGSEALETGEIRTDRRGIDADELLEIKCGKWLVDDGVERRYEDEFWELLDAEERRFARAKAETLLREEPDFEFAEWLVEDVHCRVLELER